MSGSTKTVGRRKPTYREHLGHLLTPANRNSVASVTATGLPWAVDNGAFSGFDADAFRKLVKRVSGQPRLLWVVCPDVVGDARATAALFDLWEPELRDASVPVAYVAQDGQESFEPPWDQLDAWFIGGSTRWKLGQHSADLAAEARQRGKHVHVGRVNTLRRLRAAYDMGADSVDGSCYSRWADDFLERSIQFVIGLEGQPTLFGEKV